MASRALMSPDLYAWFQTCSSATIFDFVPASLSLCAEAHTVAAQARIITTHASFTKPPAMSDKPRLTILVPHSTATGGVTSTLFYRVGDAAEFLRLPSGVLRVSSLCTSTGPSAMMNSQQLNSQSWRMQWPVSA